MEELSRLYRMYNPAVDADAFVSKAEQLFPNLNCGLASAYIRDVVGAGDIIRGKYNQTNHTFLLIDDTVVVDITADQYGGPKIYVGVLKLPWAVKNGHKNQGAISVVKLRK